MKRVIVYVVLILVFSGLGTVGLLESLSKSDNEVVVNSNEIVISGNLEDSKYELLVYLYDDVSCTDSNCRKLVKIKTETPFAKELVVKNYANYILIYDGVIKLVDVNQKTLEVVNIPYDRNKNYVVNLSLESDDEKENVDKSIESIVGSNINSISYYDYVNKKLVESKEYESIVQYDDSYYIGVSESSNFLLSYMGEELVSLGKNINANNLHKVTFNNDTYGILYTNSRNLETFLVLDSNGKELINKSGDYHDIEMGEDKVYVYESKRLVTYNLSGRIIKLVDIEKYDLKYSYKNYMFAVNDNRLIAYNIDNDDTVVLTSLSDKELVSIVYRDGSNPGIYVVLKDDLDVSFGLYYNLESKSVQNFNLSELE